jgi:Flp pilus assembly pilin Flp
MTAAIYAWFIGLSGAALIAYACVAAFVLVALVALAVEIVAAVRKRFGTWHDRVTLKHGPIRYEDRFL